MEFPQKPLGFVKQGLEEMGHSVSHVYDDLVFPSHTAYLIQFGKESHELNLYLNQDCGQEEQDSLKEDLVAVFAGRIGFSMMFPGLFSISQEDQDTLSIRFIPIPV